ncbi:MAG: prepilin-type N-terminal cleavage/methylation domain-containing protein [Pseudomonadota bacterium]|nr:prepilin-type N-terminal cleavage/methylation domain-containing protein [Pseudomonadota bacterium]
MKNDQGFSLLESLVGLTIITIVLLTLIQVGLSSSAQIKRAEDASIAASLAKTLFNRVGVENPIQKGIMKGNENSRWSWELSIIERDRPDISQMEPKIYLQLFDLKARISNDQVVYEFKTVRNTISQDTK